MPLWRCPHCGTPQAEAARCWVCRRSTTSCATCRHFRRGVTAQLGFCGLDRQRLALRGDEMRACWEASAAPTATAPGTTARAGKGVGSGEDARPRRTFVPVEELAVGGDGTLTGAPISRPPAAHLPATATDAPGWSLWGDGESPA